MIGHENKTRAARCAVERLARVSVREALTDGVTAGEERPAQCPRTALCRLKFDAHRIVVRGWVKISGIVHVLETA